MLIEHRLFFWRSRSTRSASLRWATKFVRFNLFEFAEKMDVILDTLNGHMSWIDDTAQGRCEMAQEAREAAEERRLRPRVRAGRVLGHAARLTFQQAALEQVAAIAEDLR